MKQSKDILPGEWLREVLLLREGQDSLLFCDKFSMTLLLLEEFWIGGEFSGLLLYLLKIKYKTHPRKI